MNSFELFKRFKPFDTPLATPCGLLGTTQGGRGYYADFPSSDRLGRVAREGLAFNVVTGGL